MERKWRANRLSRARLDEVRIDFMNPHEDLRKARERLKSIIRQHDAEIPGGIADANSAEMQQAGSSAG